MDAVKLNGGNVGADNVRRGDDDVLIAIADRDDFSVDHLEGFDTLPMQEAFGIAAIALEAIDRRAGAFLFFAPVAVDRFDTNDLGHLERGFHHEGRTLGVRQILPLLRVIDGHVFEIGVVFFIVIDRIGRTRDLIDVSVTRDTALLKAFCVVAFALLGEVASAAGIVRALAIDAVFAARTHLDAIRVAATARENAMRASAIFGA